MVPSLQASTLTQVVTAIAAVGALGTAAFGLVDASKLLPFLVPSCGFGYIRSLVEQFAPSAAGTIPRNSALSVAAMTDSLRANWLNGMAMADQKAVAKTLIKLRMNAETAAALAVSTGVDREVLTSVAVKLANGQSLTPAEMDTYGRFDVLLATAIDRAYQRADQMYRTTAKVASCIVAILLAEAASVALGYMGPKNWNLHHALDAFLVGLIATPLAPIAKDLTTALTSAANAVQSVRK